MVKVLVLGPAGVGKTELVSQWLLTAGQPLSSDMMGPTQGQYVHRIHMSRRRLLAIHDLAGDPLRYGLGLRRYAARAVAAMIVIDYFSPSWFSDLQHELYRLGQEARHIQDVFVFVNTWGEPEEEEGEYHAAMEEILGKLDGSVSVLISDTRHPDPQAFLWLMNFVAQ